MATVGSFNPNLTFPMNNRGVGQSPQSNGGNTNNVNGIGNTVTNNQSNAVDQSITRTDNSTRNVYNITFNEGDTINNPAQQQAPCNKKAGKGKGKGKGKAKGKAKKKGASNAAQVASPSSSQAGAAGGSTQMMFKMMSMMMNLMQQMSQGQGGYAMAGGMPNLNINSGMAQFRHPGFMA